MSIDIATLGIKVDASSADTATNALDKLTSAGGKAETATKKVAKATDELGAAAATAKTASNSAQTAATQLSGGSSKASSAIKSAATATHDYQKRVDDLLTSVFPTTNALGKLALQLKEAESLYHANAISANEYRGVEAALRLEIDKLVLSQAKAGAEAVRHANGIKEAGKSSEGALGKFIMLGRSLKQLASGDIDLITLGEGFNRAGEFARKFGRSTAAAGAEGAAGMTLLDIAMSPILLAVGAIVGVVALMAGSFMLFSHEASNSVGDVTKSLGLTKKQMERVKDSGVETSITLMDTIKGAASVIKEDLVSAFDGPLKFIKDGFYAVGDFIKTVMFNAIKYIVQGVAGGVGLILTAIRVLPGAFSDIGAAVANAFIGAIEFMVNASIKGLNGLINLANTAAEKIGIASRLDPLSSVTIEKFGRNGKAGKAFTDTFQGGIEAAEKAGKYVDALPGRIIKAATEIRKAAVLDKAGHPEKAKKPKKEPKSEAEKAYESEIKASEAYLKQLEKETVGIGQNIVQRKLAESGLITHRLMEAALTEGTTKAIAKAKELTAAIDKQTQAWISATAAEAQRKLGEARSDENTAIKFQTSLLYLNNAEKAKATALEKIRLEYQKLTRDGLLLEGEALKNATPEYKAYAAALKAANAEYVAHAEAIGNLEDQAVAAGKVADNTAMIANNLKDATGALSTFFGTAGSGFENLINVQADYAARKDAIDKELADKRKATQGQGIEYEEAVQKAGLKTAQLEKNNVSNMLSAAKTFFKEKSVGYRVLETAEKAYRAIQFAMQAQALIKDTIETVRSVINSTTRATAKGAEGIASQAKLPFPYNIAAMAATGAALLAAGIGLLGGGGGASAPPPPTSEDRQATQGTGSVLGDAKTASASLTKSMEIAASNSNKDLEYSNQMVKFLRNINDNIGSLSSLLARQLGVTGGAFDTKQLGLGTTGGNNVNIPLIGGLFGSKSTTNTLNDQGLDFNAKSVGDIIANGIQANIYQEVLSTVTKSGFLGLGKSTKNYTNTTKSAASGDLTEQVALLVGNLKSSIVEASKTIGIEGAGAMLDAFQVNIGKISLKGMTGDEVEKTLNGVFSKLGDDMVSAIYGEIGKYQKVGEGALETIVRLGRDYQVLDTALQSIGKTFSMIGLSSIEARERLVNLGGGIDDFVSKNDFFRENFLTQAEQITPVINAVASEMERLGLGGVTTKEAFKQVVSGLDLSTQSGAELYTALMNVAPAFAKVADYSDQLAANITKGLQEALAAANKAADDAAKNVDSARATLQSAYNDVIKTIEDTVTAAQKIADDAAANVSKARDNLKSSYDAALQVMANTVTAAQAIADTAASTLVTAQGNLKSAYDAALQVIADTVVAAQAVADAAAAGVDKARGNLQASYNAAKSTLQNYQSLTTLAVSNLQKSYDASIVAINGNVNELNDLAKQAATNLDAARATIKQVFDRALGDVRDTLKTATAMIETSKSNIQKLYASSLSEIEAKVAIASGNVQSARDALTAAYNAESSALNSTITKMKAFRDSFVAFRDELNGQALSQLSPEANYRNSQADFNRLSGLAASGDQDAMGKLADAGKTLLAASKEYNASSNAYFDDLATVKSAIDSVISATGGAVDTAQAQLDALNASVSGLIEINKSVLSVADAIKNLQTARDAEDKAKADADAQKLALRALVGSYINLDDTQLTIADNIANLLTAREQEGLAQAQIDTLNQQLTALIGSGDTLASIDDASQQFILALKQNDVAQQAAKEAGLNAKLQIAALDSQVEGLINIKQDTLSIADALTGVRDAMANDEIAKAQLAALDEQIGGLLTVSDNLLSVSDAISELNASIVTNDTAQAALEQAKIDAQNQTNLLNEQVLGLLAANDNLLSVDQAVTALNAAVTANTVAQAAAEQAKSDAANQTTLLNEQVSGLLAANDNLLSVDQAIAALNAAVTTNAVAQLAADQARSDAATQTILLNDQVGVLLQVNSSVVSVASAIAGLNSALSAQAAATQAAITAANAVAANAQQQAAVAQQQAAAAQQSVNTIQAQLPPVAPNDNETIVRLDNVIAELQAGNRQRGDADGMMNYRLDEIGNKFDTQNRLYNYQ